MVRDKLSGCLRFPSCKEGNFAPRSITLYLITNRLFNYSTRFFGNGSVIVIAWSPKGRTGPVDSALPEGLLAPVLPEGVPDTLAAHQPRFGDPVGHEPPNAGILLPSQHHGLDPVLVGAFRQ